MLDAPHERSIDPLHRRRRPADGANDASRPGGYRLAVHMPPSPSDSPRSSRSTAKASPRALKGAAPTTTTPKPRSRYEIRRAHVIDASASVFARKGFHATTLEDLEAATGLTRGGLYHYMDGKQDLLIQIHERFIRPLLENAREIVARGEKPEVELRLLARALVQDIATYRDPVAVFLHEWRIIEDEPEWKDIRQGRKEFEDMISSCLRRGVKDGTFQDMDVRTTMRGFLGMINYTYQWLNPKGKLTADAVADQFAGMILNGIRAEPQPQPRRQRKPTTKS
jgi:AcrR family transcriptional regulator